MKEFTFFVPGQPRPKGRPRFTRSGRTYTPKTTLAAQKEVAQAYQANRGPWFGEVPVSVEIRFHRRGQEVTITELDVGERTFKRGDIDNMAKLTLDALNSVAFADDRQVVELRLFLETKENKKGE